MTGENYTTDDKGYIIMNITWDDGDYVLTYKFEAVSLC